MTNLRTIEWHPIHVVEIDVDTNDKKIKKLMDEGYFPDFEWRGSMPDKENQYLVTLSDGTVTIDDFYIHKNDGLFLFEWWNNEIDVIAWAELPEGFKNDDIQTQR